MRYPCDVELISRQRHWQRRCGTTPAEPFTARCACGHQISGHMCSKCAHSRFPGCNTCWAGGNGAGHYCPVTFAEILTGGAA
jgi:hypothetical protein